MSGVDLPGVPEARSASRLRFLPVPALADSVRAMIPLVAAIVGVGAFATARSAQFLTLTNFQNIFQQIAVIAILAVGATLLMVAGQLDLSVGSGVSLASIVGAEMLVNDVDQAWVVLGLLALGLVIGIATGAIVATTRVQPFILTLGGLSVLYAIALILSRQRPIPTGLSFAKLSFEDWGPFPVPAVLLAALLLVGAALLRFARLGRSAYAIGSNEEAAYLAGVPVVTTKILLYAFNGLLVGVGGLMLIARLGSGDPNGGAGLELQAVTAVVLGGATLSGGRGTMLGTFLGVFLLGLITNALNIAGVPNSYEQLVFGGVLIVAVVWAAVSDLRRGASGPFLRQLAVALTRLKELRRRSR